jgi:hypothetical protein
MERICKYCRAFFLRFRCNKPQECDCPRCQGYCRCVPKNVVIPGKYE